jgi:hypothetical protein
MRVLRRRTGRSVNATNVAQEEMDLKYGIVTINEIRGERALVPVPWGQEAWLPNRLWFIGPSARSAPGAIPRPWPSG